MLEVVCVSVMKAGVLASQPVTSTSYRSGSPVEKAGGGGHQQLSCTQLGLSTGREHGPAKLSGGFTDSFLLFAFYNYF